MMKDRISSFSPMSQGHAFLGKQPVMLQSEQGIYFLRVAQRFFSSTLHPICKVRESERNHSAVTDDTATGKWETQQYLGEKSWALRLSYTCRKMAAKFNKHFCSVFRKKQVDVLLPQKNDEVLSNPWWIEKIESKSWTWLFLVGFYRDTYQPMIVTILLSSLEVN